MAFQADRERANEDLERTRAALQAAKAEKRDAIAALDQMKAKAKEYKELFKVGLLGRVVVVRVVNGTPANSDCWTSHRCQLYNF